MSGSKFKQYTLPGVFIKSAKPMLTNTGLIIFFKLIACIAGAQIASNSVGTVLVAFTGV